VRRGKYLKGKQVGKGAAVEIGAMVKKGQVLCYVEQLGTHWPVEAPQVSRWSHCFGVGKGRGMLDCVLPALGQVQVWVLDHPLNFACMRTSTHAWMPLSPPAGW
jgi:hypothetical protein